MGKNRRQMRGDLRLDLKDAATTWEDAELDRCIEKAVGDLSRFLPDEKMYEESLQFTVTDESFTTPIDTDDDRVVDNEPLVGLVAGALATIDGQPDVPRPLSILVVDADSSLKLLTIIVSGTDEDDEAITETFHYSRGRELTWMGKKYFKTVYSVEIDQVASNADGDAFEIGIGAYTDVWVSLGYKPIKKGSVTITDEAEDTDFVMDYTNGRIKAITLDASTAETPSTYSISYTKSKISLDLSSLPGYIRTCDIEYPYGELPQESPSHEMFGDVVTVTSMQDTSQSEMYEDKHIAVRYYARHDAPTESAPGTYPDFLENTVELAASAYALFMIAAKYEHQVATDISGVAAKITLSEGAIESMDSLIGLATSELTQTTAIHTLVDAALDRIEGKVVDSVAALADAATQASGATSALVKVTTYLETNPAGDGGDENAKYWLTKITTDIGELRTAITGALEVCDNYLDRIGAVTGVEATEGDLEAARLVWAEEVKHILTDAGIPNAEDLLETGDDKIDLVNIGADVAEVYRRYAETTLNMAEKWAGRRRDLLSQAARRTEAAYGYVSMVAQRLSNLRSYIEQAEGWGRIATGFVEEAAQRVATAHAFLGKANGYMAVCRAFTEEAMARISEIRTHIEEADVYVRAAALHGNAATPHTADAAILQTSAATHGELAEKFREEAIERRNEAWAIWRDPKQYIGQFSISSRRQAYSSTT